MSSEKDEKKKGTHRMKERKKKEYMMGLLS